MQTKLVRLCLAAKERQPAAELTTRCHFVTMPRNHSRALKHIQDKHTWTPRNCAQVLHKARAADKSEGKGFEAEVMVWEVVSQRLGQPLGSTTRG